jgi:hypothetical protein
MTRGLGSSGRVGSRQLRGRIVALVIVAVQKRRACIRIYSRGGYSGFQDDAGQNSSSRNISRRVQRSIPMAQRVSLACRRSASGTSFGTYHGVSRDHLQGRVRVRYNRRKGAHGGVPSSARPRNQRCEGSSSATSRRLHPNTLRIQSYGNWYVARNCSRSE